MFKAESFSIRTIKPEDRNRILEWRNSDRVRVNMYSDQIISPEEHDAWFERGLEGKTGIFLIFQYEMRPIGLISFTQIDKKQNRCSWAFYLGETDVPRGCGSVMEYFALEYAFLELKIRKLCCEVFAFNEGVIKLHEKFGFAQEGRLKEHQLKNGKFEDIVCMAQFDRNWNAERMQFHSRLFGK